MKTVRGDNEITRRITCLSCCSLHMVILFLFLMLLVSPVAAANNNSSSEGIINQTVTNSIAAAVAGAEPGSVLLIESGEWGGNFVIDKPISLLGMDSGTGKPHIITKEGLAGITITSDNVTIEGFTISGDADCAVWIEGNDTIISDNTFLGTPIAISIISGDGLSFSGNSINNHSVGIYADKNVSGVITLNNFDNRVNAKSLTTTLNWSSDNSSYLYENEIYNSSLGNYWDDYKGSDDDGNGIGSTPYMPYTSASDIRDAVGSDFIGSLSDEGVKQIYEGYWKGLFRNENYVKDKYPLISENSMYVVVPKTTQADIITAGGVNGTSGPTGIPIIQLPENISINLSVPGGNGNTSVQATPGGTGGDPARIEPMLSLQNPFEIVFVMVLIAGVFAGLIGILGKFGRIYGLKGGRKYEVAFMGLAFGAMSIALLYTVVSYTSRLIYGFIDYGMIQVAFIFVTAYLIMSSAFLAFGLLSGRFPLNIYRLQSPVAIVATVLLGISIYTVPVELGPVTGMAYPAALLLSIVLPLVFRHRFKSLVMRWYAEKGDVTASSFDPDSTSLFMKEEDIMSSSLSSSYFPESLHDKYSDVEFIGKGGIARVFKAKRRKDGVVVAVKVPINFDETTGRLFLKEMRIWEGLEHPNIAKLHSVNIFPVPYVEMEYLETPLSAVEKPLPPVESLRIIYDVAEGLSYAHSRGIIHRDIKPQNIMLSADKTAKITDWGLGKIMSDGNETTIIGFSLNYAAPEQVAPKTFGYPDERTDIYQLGIVFYELITGKKPFSGSGVAEVTDEILHLQPVVPSKAGARDDLFDDVVMKCLNKNQDERFSSVDEFKKFLTGIVLQNDGLKEFFKDVEPSG
ncbi:serine/threonine protein kinase [Methanolacinia petrolearia DSM 11571]|uniref:Serine/threonine protein kinase n=2 Tax=Methanolacinia TaxID=230355 RepID=E1RFR9_METP4|nr:serine/threonine protein kinase [Methanolacinia petrolearia DSM 11571]